MRYSRPLLIFAFFFSFSVSADVTPQQRCEKQGEVAEKASDLRLSGADKDAATRELTEFYDPAKSGVTAKDIENMVMIAYMARMKPVQTRDYVIAECKKDIPK